MRKLSLIIVAVTVIIAFTGMLNKGEAAEIYGCYKKNNGQLRIVNSSGKCLPSEKPIVLNQSDGRYEFVGFSTAKSNGAAGILKFTQMCQADFPNSRICTSVNILTTVDVPSASGTGWVQPVIVGSGNNSVGQPVAIDASGISEYPYGLTCNGWSDSSQEGLTVSADGKFSQNACSDVLPVACCAP